MLLSDRDIKAELGAGRIALEPYEPEMVQPSSIDVRLDRFFRLFDNHKYPFIDPSVDQPELTRFVEVDADQPFILHPGEFVLGSTFELVSLPDDVAARLEISSAASHGSSGIHGVELERASGTISLERLVPNVATLLQPGQPDHDVALPRRSLRDCLAEELRRLDPDDLFGEVVQQGVPQLPAPAKKSAKTSAKKG